MDESINNLYSTEYDVLYCLLIKKFSKADFTE